MTKSEEWAHDIRREIIEASHDVGRQGVHLGSALSATDILAVLYADVLKYDVTNPISEDRDFFILSKGHAYIGYYATLARAGFFTNEDIKQQFMTDNGWLPVHPVKKLDKGIEFSGGSLGTGMPYSVGKAYALKVAGKPNKVYSLVGDGECDEGLIWESAMAASNYKLNNFVVIIDCNKLQYDGLTTEVMDNSSLADKFKAFGFDAIEVNGHDVNELTKALTSQSEKPLCVIAHTIKGKGASFAEGHREWHHHTLSEQEYNQARKEVEDGNA